MNRMRKIAALAVLICLLLSLVSCRSGGRERLTGAWTGGNGKLVIELLEDGICIQPGKDAGTWTLLEDGRLKLTDPSDVVIIRVCD